MTVDLDELYSELSEFATPKKEKALTNKEERVLAGFEEIQRFVEQHSRLPQHGEVNDIFERLYAVRLERLQKLTEFHPLLNKIDHQGLLSGKLLQPSSLSDDISEDDLLAELTEGQSNITQLKHVRSQAERQAAEEVANRERCADFEQFKPLFANLQKDIENGVRKIIPFGSDTSVKVGSFFILFGQTAYVAEEGEEFDSPQGKKDARLRVIFSNGTESNMLRLSLVRSLYKDDTSRRITSPDLGPLFSDQLEDGDQESGTIYVLRSYSNNPYVSEHRNLIHKIGVTGSCVEKRIANALHDATYLLAEVEVVATYKLANINRTKLENLLHKFFASAKLDLTIEDRFGFSVKPQEWFLVPLEAIDEAVQRIQDGSITQYSYSPEQAKLVPNY